jgi:hypothetical protein
MLWSRFSSTPARSLASTGLIGVGAKKYSSSTFGHDLTDGAWRGKKKIKKKESSQIPSVKKRAQNRPC